MRGKYFYSHLIETSEISLELGEMDLEPKERTHLATLVEANIHSVVLHTVLSELTEEDKKIFLKNVNESNHQATWKHLKKKIKDVEEKIKNVAKELKKEFYKDIQQTKKLTPN